MNRPINRRMITLSIMAATIMQTLDTTIANVTLPHMQGSMSAAQDQITWVLTAYIVAAAIATPLTGWLCDRFSQKSVFLASVAGFTVASTLCGLSGSLVELVGARLLQGVFGAALVPLAQVVLLDINPPEKQGPAMAIWGLGVMVGPILGPTLGGWLTDTYNWRWVFFINIPVGVAAYYGIWKYIRPVPGARAMTFDAFGFTTLSLGIGALQIMLDRGQHNDWFSSTETWIEAAVMIVAFTYFIAHSRLMPAGGSFVDFRLLKNRNYVSGLMFIFVVGMVLYATRALTPTMLESLLGYPVATTGLLTAPAGVGTMAAMWIVGRMVGRVDLRLLLLGGFLGTAFALWQMSHYALTLTESDIVWPGVIQGFSVGFVFVPLAAATFATLAPSMRAQGTAIFSLVRNIGSSIGISLVQAMLVRNTATAHAALVERITTANPAWQDPAVAGALNPAHPAGAAALDALVTQQAVMIAYIDDFLLMLILTLLVLPLLLLLQVPRANAPTADAHAVME